MSVCGCTVSNPLKEDTSAHSYTHTPLFFLFENLYPLLLASIIITSFHPTRGNTTLQYAALQACAHLFTPQTLHLKLKDQPFHHNSHRSHVQPAPTQMCTLFKFLSENVNAA